MVQPPIFVTPNAPVQVICNHQCSCGKSFTANPQEIRLASPPPPVQENGYPMDTSSQNYDYPMDSFSKQQHRYPMAPPVQLHHPFPLTFLDEVRLEMYQKQAQNDVNNKSPGPYINKTHTIKFLSLL
jgi:hypothetical protein